MNAKALPLSVLAVTAIATTGVGLTLDALAQTPAQNAGGNPFAAEQQQREELLEQGRFQVITPTDQGDAATNLEVKLCTPNGTNVPTSVVVRPIPKNPNKLPPEEKTRLFLSDLFSAVYGSASADNPPLSKDRGRMGHF